MGYRSDVVLGLAFETPEDMDKVLSAYAVEPLVQEHNSMAAWEIDRDAARMFYFDTCVKWYEGYEDVQAVHKIEEVAKELANRQGFKYGTYYLRLGENINDTEEEHGGNAMELSNEVSDLVNAQKSS